MQGFPQPESHSGLHNETALQHESAAHDHGDGGRVAATTSPSPSDGPRPHPNGNDPPNSGQTLSELELDAALQLLVERAQYITGATGAALALPHAGEMVCRASAGSCAPAVGASLQVRSGLTGESISRRQLLRCDNAESDPRVNLATCRALGIASIVVLPLLRRNGEVRGLFELFSDHPYAFEERDLIALERMADLTLTALDLAEQRHGVVPPARVPPPVAIPAEASTADRAETQAPTLPASALPAPAAIPAPDLSISLAPTPLVPEPQPPTRVTEALPVPTVVQSTVVAGASAPSVEPPPADLATSPATAPEPSQAALPESMRRVRKCSACGFPVSEGRSLCLDCEKKQGAGSVSTAPAATEETRVEDIPAFLANAQPVKESWLANHVNLLAIVVLILGVLVAVVVFR